MATFHSFCAISEGVFPYHETGAINLTEENYNYRTSPMFLRNQFSGSGMWSIPIIPKFVPSSEDLDGLRLIGFDKVKSGKDEHYKRMVHFFLYDYKFEDIWINTEKYVEILGRYSAVLTPDFSMYLEMNPVLQLYNTFRNRWCGAYLADKGLRVVPTVNWGLENRFDFCFNGIEKGSAVAVSTYMVTAHDNHSDQKEFFLKGYNEMLKRIEPELIICYHYPFPEMRGNILFVDYDLSSWQHDGDDLDKSCLYTQTERYLLGYDSIPEQSKIITKFCSGHVISDVEKGSGSAFGGKWRPSPDKPEDQRFFGRPGDVKTTYTQNGERFNTKIGNDGRAEKERHYTDHNRPWTHSNPHDHLIEWDENDGHPIWVKPIINYFFDEYPDGIPEFKSLKGLNTLNMIVQTNTPEQNRFKTISDFLFCMKCGGEVEFEWKGTYYSITHTETKIGISEAYKQETEKLCDTADEVLEYLVSGDRLRDVITKVYVLLRTI